MPSRRLLAAAATLSLATPHAFAAAPPPYDPARFAFPGSVHSPATAASAGLAGADRWISPVAGGNPAAAPSSNAVTLSPLVQRISRQDLSAANREFSQTSVFLDAASGQWAMRLGDWGLRLEAAQPAFRSETSTFSIGLGDGSSAPARVQVDAQMRELRGGLAVSRAIGAWRVGLSGEWTQRSDRYATTEVSGSPDAGERELSLDGSGLGGALGVTWARAVQARWGVELGATLRQLGAIDADYESINDLAGGLSTLSGDASRDGSWEGGVAARITVDPRGGHAWLSFDGRGAERWPGLSLATEPATAWRLGYSYRDARSPWSLRVGFGQDVQPGAPEPRATAVGLGLGWQQDDLGLDLGVTHRSIRRGDSPTQADSRIVASLTVGL